MLNKHYFFFGLLIEKELRKEKFYETKLETQRCRFLFSFSAD